MSGIVPVFISQPPECSVSAELEDAVRRVLEEASTGSALKCTVNIMFTDERTIRELNRAFRGKDVVTDVLSFPASAFEGMLEDHVRRGGPVEMDGALVELGDIAVCVERAAQQAGEIGHSLQREIQFLTLHGYLHLLGYDHTTPDEEEVMTAVQRTVMRNFEE